MGGWASKRSSVMAAGARIMIKTIGFIESPLAYCNKLTTLK